MAARPRNRLRSIYTPSLHPLASPPPIQHNCQRRPANPERRVALRTRAPVTLQGRGAIAPVPNWYADAPLPLQATPMSETAAFPGLAVVGRLGGGKVCASRCRAAVLPSALSRPEEDLPASGRPRLRCAPSTLSRGTWQKSFFCRDVFLRTLGDPLSP